MNCTVFFTLRPKWLHAQLPKADPSQMPLEYQLVNTGPLQEIRAGFLFQLKQPELAF